MEIDYNSYHVFVEVAREKSITAASKKLFLTQPTVSRIIKQLENNLNCTLFLRSKRGVELTEEGKVLLQHAEMALQQFDIAREKLEQRKNFEHGTLHIGVTEMTMQYFLLPFLEQFKEDYPNVHIQLSFEYPGSLLKQLNTGVLDIAVLTTPLTLDDTVSCEYLSEFQDILIAGPKYFSLAEGKRKLSDVASFPFILMEDGTSARNYIEDIFRQHQVEIHAEYNVSSMPMIVPMVTRNLGIGFIPTVYVQREFFRDDVRRIYLEEEFPVRYICMITSNVLQKSALCKEFISRLE